MTETTTSRVAPFYRRKWFLGLVGVLVLLFAAYKALPYYLSYSMAGAESFDGAIAAFEEEDRANPPEPGSVLFIGSSSIRFWDTLERDMAPIPVINRGFGGSMLHHSTHFADRIVTPYQPAAIVIYAGDNDISNLFYPRDAEQVAEDFDAFSKAVCESLGDVPIVYIGIKPSTRRAEHWQQMQRVNRLIESRAEAHRNLYFVDIAPAMLDDAGKARSEYLIFDGLHLNAEGYALWTSLVRPVLERALEEANAPGQGGIKPSGCDIPA